MSDRVVLDLDVLGAALIRGRAGIPPMSPHQEAPILRALDAGDALLAEVRRLDTPYRRHQEWPTEAERRLRDTIPPVISGGHNTGIRLVAADDLRSVLDTYWKAFSDGQHEVERLSARLETAEAEVRRLREALELIESEPITPGVGCHWCGYSLEHKRHSPTCAATIAGAALAPQPRAPSPPSGEDEPTAWCGRCSGTGWTEGGKTLKTPCPDCAEDEDRRLPDDLFGDPVPPAPLGEAQQGTGGIAAVEALHRAVQAPSGDLREAAERFLAKYDEVEPAIVDAFAFKQGHGMTYTGPDFGEELKALRLALSPAPKDGT